MKRKIVSVLLCSAMVATMAMGCGGKEEPAADEAKDGGKDGGLIKVGTSTMTLTSLDSVQQTTKT